MGDPAVVQRVFDQMPLLVAAVEGPELRIVAATAMFRAWTGRQDVLGQPATGTFAALAGHQALPMLQRAYASGKPESLRELRVEPDPPATGEGVEHFIDLTATPLFGADNKVVGLILDVVDVTEQLQQRRAAGARQRREWTRDMIDMLQRDLLPAGLPVLPSVQVAAAHLPADAAAAGGDWFDAVPLPGGRIALVVGDVVGHGVAASATMGQLRVLLHDHLATTADVAAALSALDAGAGRVRGARAATVCVVVLDPVTGSLEYCTAGHPPPLVLSPAGKARYLTVTGAGPIGVGGAFTSASIGNDRLSHGETVVLYTLGILEHPGRDLARSTIEFAQAAGDAVREGTDSAVERLCTRTLQSLVPATDHTEDVTLLAAQRVTPPADLAMSVPTTREAVRTVRERFDDWLTGIRVDRHDADALRHAVVELITNVVDHAAQHTGTFEVTAVLTDTGHLEVRVADRGRWRESAPSPDRGLGLHMAENLVDTLHIEHDENGTTATVRLRASIPARLITTGELSERPPATPPAQAEPMLVLDQPSAPRPRIRVDGAIDEASVAEFDRLTRVASVTGTRSLTLDLSGVTHLASAGVAALHQLLAVHRRNGTTLRLYAPAGSPADMILSLVQVRHETLDPDYPHTVD
nr:SpoIIE family protein phosphatase [uncultured Actinoplanes sp.]